MYVNLTDRLKYVQSQISLDDIKNKTDLQRPNTNIFILLIRKYEKLTLKAKYKYFYIINKKIWEAGSQGQVQILLYY